MMLSFIASIPVGLKTLSYQSLTPRRPRAHRIPLRSRSRISHPLIRCAQDHYKVLEIEPSADPATIKRAYRRAALKNHPDVSKEPDARDRFLRVQEAYAVLSDKGKRSSYDRRRNSGFPSGFEGFSGGSTGFGGFDTNEYVKRWREKNPMPDDIDDNFGNIFNDIFSGVADAVRESTTSGGGIAEDFIEFLEKRADGFGVSIDDSDGLNDVLRSGDEDVLKTEIEDANFLLQHLRSRKAQAEKEEKTLRTRAKEWGDRKERAENRKEFLTRDAAKEREEELTKEADRFSKRLSKTNKHIRKQEDRLKKLQDRLDEIKAEKSTEKTSSPSYQPNASQSRGRDESWTSKDKKTKEASINEELEKMKKELGL